jgi:hypothetical protein
VKYSPTIRLSSVIDTLQTFVEVSNASSFKAITLIALRWSYRETVKL